MSRILIVLSSADTWVLADGSEYDTGYWAEELVVPHERFVQASTLRERGARYERGPNWAPYVVRDGRLISGQNPASSGPMADAVLSALS